jgi:hypothetical protein
VIIPDGALQEETTVRDVKRDDRDPTEKNQNTFPGIARPATYHHRGPKAREEYE